MAIGLAGAFGSDEHLMNPPTRTAYNSREGEAVRKAAVGY